MDFGIHLIFDSIGIVTEEIEEREDQPLGAACGLHLLPPQLLLSAPLCLRMGRCCENMLTKYCEEYFPFQKYFFHPPSILALCKGDTEKGNWNFRIFCIN